MSEAARPGIGTHYLRYTIGSVLVMLAGFVSFPIMTRLLNNTEYGIFGYFDSWLLILGAVLKLGGQHSIVRFYPHRGGSRALARFGPNFILLPFASSCILWLLGLVAFGAISAFDPPLNGAIAWIMLLLLLPTVWISYVGAVLMAQERSELSVRVSVGSRWLQVFAVLGILYFVQRSALGVYIAQLGVAVVVALGLAIWLWRRIPMHWRARNSAGWREGLRYGIPMMANELSGILLAFVDRLMLRHMLGAFAPVGVYSIGYGLAMNINNLMNTTLSMAYTQVSVRQFETEGAARVVQTKRVALHILVYVAIAMIVGLVTVGSDALLLLAGHDKSASAPVFVLIGINYTLCGMFGICAAGLELHKRSATIFAITLGTTLLNVALNLIWIPRFGVMGSVYATLVSYGVFYSVRFAMCPRELRALPDGRATLIACGLGILVWFVAYFTSLFGVTSHLMRLMVMAALMLVLFALPALALDRALRETLIAFWHKRRAGHV